MTTALTDLKAYYDSLPSDIQNRRGAHLIKTCTTQLETALSLIDGCYEIVELVPETGPDVSKWKQQWLAQAKILGAGSDLPD